VNAVFSRLKGNEKIKTAIGERILNGTIGHAIILEGPKGSGRHTAALEIAASFACKERSEDNLPCGHCLGCRKVYEGYCPDLFMVNSGEKATIGVDTIRDMISSLCFAPLESDRKVYVIEDAEKMTRQAQNTLLLSLEEPPEYIFFILITASAASLLETVRSRAPIFRMERFPSDVITEYLLSTSEGKAVQKRDSALIGQIAAASNGVIGKAIELSSPKDSKKLSERREAALDAVQTLCCGNTEECVSAALKLSADKAKTLEVLSDMKLILRDCACFISGATEMMFFTDTNDVKEYSRQMSIRRVHKAYKSVCEACDMLARNSNLSGTISSMMMSRVLGKNR
jgi:DNA polymerase-3 subunit delta'